MLRIHLRSTRTDPLFPFTTLLRSPNLTAGAPGWRAARRDVRFRRALSLGIDRAELNQVLYQGTALPGADALLPGSPLYDEAHRKAWSVYDPKQANALPDELGMIWKDADGIRHLPEDRTSVASGKRVSVRVILGGRSVIKNK